MNWTTSIDNLLHYSRDRIHDEYIYYNIDLLVLLHMFWILAVMLRNKSVTAVGKARFCWLIEYNQYHFVHIMWYICRENSELQQIEWQHGIPT